MREAWFEIIKGAKDRKGVDPAYKRRSKKKLDERIAAEKELDNRRGKKGSILDEKGRQTLQDVKDLTSEEKRKDRKAMNQSRKEGFSQGVKNILGRGKKAGKKLFEAGKKGAKALNPNTYLPDPSATGTGKPVDIRAKDPISGKPKFNRITTRENEEAKDIADFRGQMGQFQQRAIGEPLVAAEEAKTESERKKKLRGNIASQAAQQAQLDRLKTNKVAEETQAQAEYDALEQQRLESGRKAGEVADEQARKDLIAEQQQQAKATRDAKIKEMGEVNRQRAEAAREAARKEANTTVMPKIGGLKPQTKPVVSMPQAFSPTIAQRAKAGNTRQAVNTTTTGDTRTDAERAAQYRKNKRAKMTQNTGMSAEQLGLNPNVPPKKKRTGPPPPQPQQPQQNQLQQMSQQAQQQRQQGQQALQQQVAAQQKRANWKKVMRKPTNQPQSTKVPIQ
jgi:hypothetical protein